MSKTDHIIYQFTICLIVENIFLVLFIQKHGKTSPDTIARSCAFLIEHREYLECTKHELFQLFIFGNITDLAESHKNKVMIGSDKEFLFVKKQNINCNLRKQGPCHPRMHQKGKSLISLRIITRGSVRMSRTTFRQYACLGLIL